MISSELLLVVVLLLLSGRGAESFLPPPRTRHHRSHRSIVSERWTTPKTTSGRFHHLLQSTAVPTVDQLANDSFMQQVSHSEALVAMLAASSSSSDETKDGSLLVELLTAQLSHSNGIRGFFVTYLTAIANDDGDNTPAPADAETVPPALVAAMKEALKMNDENDLVSLACMNVIMPTAMVTMHADEELAAQSQITAERGLRILQCLLHELEQDGNDNLMRRNCQAIWQVATDASATDDNDDGKELRSYWADFFEKWGYKELQKRDIEAAMLSALKA